jgi:ABC-type sugar transport system permease subunit
MNYARTLGIESAEKTFLPVPAFAARHRLPADVSLYPFLSGIGYSFTSTGWINDQAKLIGLDNYRQILSGNIGVARFFKLALVQSLEWTILVITGQFIMAMGTALLLNEKFPGRSLFRSQSWFLSRCRQ